MSSYSEWKAKREREQIKGKQHIPMITADTFYYRDNKLREAGILEWERFWLVSHKLNTAGAKEMLKTRRDVFNTASDTHYGLKEYEDNIVKQYEDEHWTFNNGDYNPFDMLTHYRDKYNADVTPGSKKAKKTRDFIAAKKATELKERERLI